MAKLTVWLNAPKLILLIWGFTFSSSCIWAQSPSKLSIQEVYRLARDNYPMIKQRDLISKTKTYTVDNAAKGYLPVFSVNGQATYQSAVTSFPFNINIPGFTLPVYSKDQYKIYGQLDQVIYDGGIIKNQQQVAEANEQIQQQSLEVELYALYDRVNQLFFGTLLVNEQLKQNEILKKDIQNGIDKAQAQVNNGTAFRSTVDELSAQLLQAEQARIELLASRKAFADMLSLFIKTPVTENTILEKPAAPEMTDQVSRPELTLYGIQRKSIDLQDDLLKTQLRPKFNVFVQGGYGRPGLNMLSNDFAWYYIGGLKLNWNIGSLYTLKNQKHLLDINRKNIDVQQETFLFNTQIMQQQQHAELDKYTNLLKTDQHIIDLRNAVKNAAAAQLENGVLSAHDYLTQVNAEDQARQNLILHEIQWLQSQFNFRNTSGNIKP